MAVVMTNAGVEVGGAGLVMEGEASGVVAGARERMTRLVQGWMTRLTRRAEAAQAQARWVE